MWSQPCYDWWEEHPDHEHVSTLGAIAAGLDAVLGCGFLIREIAAAVARPPRETSARRFDAMASTRVTQ